MPWFGLRRACLVVFIPTFILLISLFAFINKQFRFEQFLHDSSITFDDFPENYQSTVVAGMASADMLTYQYATWPEPDTHSTIPKIIHFIWFKDLYHDHLDVSRIPHDGSDAPKKCRKSNPDFTIHVWNATAARELLENHYAWFIPTYDSYQYPIQRVDAFKYFVLLHYGGIYLDMDIACLRSLVPLLAVPAWFPKAQPLGVNNDAMASRAGHPIVAEMTQSLKSRKWNLLFPYVTIYWSTGPQFTSDIIKRWWTTHQAEPLAGGLRNTDEDFDTFYVLPLPFYSEEYRFLGHSPGGTWHGSDVAVILWIVANPWVLAVAGVPIILFVIYLFRRRSRAKRLHAVLTK